MTEENEPEPAKSGTGQTEAERVRRQAPPVPSNDDKPDEGLRPDQLTSESDGGSQG